MLQSARGATPADRKHEGRVAMAQLQSFLSRVTDYEVMPNAKIRYRPVVLTHAHAHAHVLTLAYALTMITTTTITAATTTTTTTVTTILNLLIPGAQPPVTRCVPDWTSS